MVFSETRLIRDIGVYVPSPSFEIAIKSLLNPDEDITTIQCEIENTIYRVNSNEVGKESEIFSQSTSKLVKVSPKYLRDNRKDVFTYFKRIKPNMNNKSSWRLLYLGTKDAILAWEQNSKGYSLEKRDSMLPKNTLDVLRDVSENQFINLTLEKKYNYLYSVYRYSADHQNKSGYCAAIDSANGNYVIFNSRLFDHAGNPINVLAKRFLQTSGEEKLAEYTKIPRDLSKFKFDSDPSDVKFYPRNYQPDIFTVEQEVKIDFSHILEERQFRLSGGKDYPVHIKRMALMYAVEDSKRKFGYGDNVFLPFYNYNSDAIQYLIPYYLTSDTKADAALVVDLRDGMFQVKTILNLADAYVSARVVQRMSYNWLMEALQ